jgi:hypothetical protein
MRYVEPGGHSRRVLFLRLQLGTPQHKWSDKPSCRLWDGT